MLKVPLQAFSITPYLLGCLVSSKGAYVLLFTNDFR